MIHMASLKEKHEAFIREIRSLLTEEPPQVPNKKRRNRKHSDSDDIQDMLDIQRELERKFDELFGCEDDD